MGVWGTGITQNDQFRETYELFMQEYDKGKSVADITADILEEFLDQFDEKSEVLHDVYFALAKSQWMCGNISKDVMDRVTEIIQSGENLRSWTELGATDEELKQRQRNLNQFLKRLQTPRDTIRRRKKPEESYIPTPKPVFPAFPNINPGDLFAYPCKDGWRIFLVVQIEKIKTAGKLAMCFVWRECYKQIPDIDTLLSELGQPLCVRGDGFPDDMQAAGQMRIPRGLSFVITRTPLWYGQLLSVAKKYNFYGQLPASRCMTLGWLLKKNHEQRSAAGLPE